MKKYFSLSMRSYFYILAGITSALIGWNLGQVFLTDFKLLKEFPELILFPCIALSLAVGMVFTEIFISSPTRPKLCWRIAFLPLMIAAGLGILAGLISGSISQIVLLPQIKFDTRILRILCWLLIGTSTGLAEGITWRWHSIEAGDKQRFLTRLKTSVIASTIASLVAALIFEILRQIGAFSSDLRGAEDPVGFSILGMLLGFAFSNSTSPSYMAALRAGKGFEYTGENYGDDFHIPKLPSPPKKPTDYKPTILVDNDETENPSSQPVIARVNDDQVELKFVSSSEGETVIEEGLSIQLPAAGLIRIGSPENRKAHIRIPGIPRHVADLTMTAREAFLKPNPKFYGAIAINGRTLGSPQEISLKHNNTLTFHLQDEAIKDDKKFYRFVYYNRFLDPQA